MDAGQQVRVERDLEHRPGHVLESAAAEDLRARVFEGVGLRTLAERNDAGFVVVRRCGYGSGKLGSSGAYGDRWIVPVR
jgi:hypothetical protein